MTSITSRANDNVKLFKKLSSSARERGRLKLFTLEGARLAADAARSGVTLGSVFVTSSALKKYPGELSFVNGGKCGKVFLISDEIAELMAETCNTQGVFAVCGMPDEKKPREIISAAGKYICLCGIRDPGNMGTIIRTADAAGIDGIICCGSCDIYNPKVIRSAMGSILHVNIASCGADDALEAFSEAGVRTCAAVVRGADMTVTEYDFSKGTAVLIGNEGSGLSPDIAEKCDHKITIPMKGRAESLNAAMAAGIIIWELTK